MLKAIAEFFGLLRQHYKEEGGPVAGMLLMVVYALGATVLLCYAWVLFHLLVWAVYALYGVFYECR